MTAAVLPNQTIRIATPDGTLFAIITEKKNGEIEHFKLLIGKSGASVMAWADALAAMMTLAVQKGATLEELITLLSSITSDRSARTINNECRSGPEGVWKALIKYRQRDEIIEDDDEPYKGSRGASVAPWAKVRRHG